MTLKIGSKYTLRFEINNKELVFTGIIKDDDGTIITFEDKYGKELSYNRCKLISAEVLSNE